MSRPGPECVRELEAQVATLEERLRDSEARAYAADRRKDEFLALLGHELRNPLAPIVTALELLDQLADPRAARERDVIRRQVRHLTRLVDDLLDVARLTRGEVRLARAPVELRRVVSQAVELASPLLEQRSHHLAIAVPCAGMLVDADEARLAQVVANLLTNAAKYTAPRGHIAVTASRTDTQIEVHVRDDGIGIPAPMLASIFELFVRGERADRSEGGLGVGLTLVRSLVALHGGAVSARSDGPGMGSEFVVQLPAAPPPLTAARSTPPVTPAPGGLRILLVDDNIDAAELLADALRALGHAVAIANDGPAALALAPDFHPEIGLLDIGLPVMDGYELARRLRAQVGDDPLRLIAVTGYGQDADRERSRRAGFEQHFVKPVELAPLAAAISSPLVVASD